MSVNGFDNRPNLRLDQASKPGRQVSNFVRRARESTRAAIGRRARARRRDRAPIVGSAGVGEVGAEQERLHVALVSDIGRLQRPVVQPAPDRGLDRAGKQLSDQDRVVNSDERGRDCIPNLTAAARRRHDLDLRRRLPHCADDHAVAKRFPDTQVRDHRLPGERAVYARASREERRRARLRRARGRMPRR